MQANAKYASIVIDAQTGEVVHAVNADTRNYPASLTKLMTLYLIFDALEAGKLKLDQRVPVGASVLAPTVTPTKLGIMPGDTIRVEDAILALVTKSANDVAVVMAEAIGGSEARFGTMMTEKARKLGMSRTTFRNPHGLPNANQFSTARDMARLGQALIKEHGSYYHYFNTRTFTYKGMTIRNHNRLMETYPGMDGMKTGFTNASGFNLVASAKRDGRRLIGVVMGGQTGAWRNQHMAGLLDKGFAGGGARVLVASARPNGKIAKGKAPGPTLGEVVNAVASADIGLAGTAVAAPLAQPLPTAQLVATGGWSVQVGAFADRSAGQRAVAQAAEKAGGLLNAAVPQIMEMKSGTGTLYRARLVGLDEKSARAACSRLTKAGTNCMTLPPAAAS